MVMRDCPLILHVGYPKSATTTFQKHVFPKHPDIRYLGKLIPSFRYVDDRLYGLIDDLLHRDRLRYSGTSELRGLVESMRKQETDKSCVLLSSESFIHPSVVDLATVADRIHKAFSPCKILITIREQIGSILSFYWMHGRFGQYLTIGPRDERTQIHYPIPFGEWISYQESSYERNYLSTLSYLDVIRYYVGKFGTENVHVLLYEALKSQPDDYARELANHLGVDGAKLQLLLQGKHELQGRGRPQVSEEPRDRGGMMSWLRQKGAPNLVRQKMAGELGPVVNDAMLARLRDKYRVGNGELEREFSLPLTRYGYAV